MISFSKFIFEEEHKACDHCSQLKHPDDLHAAVSEAGVHHICKDCRDNSDMEYCGRCERLHEPHENSKECHECIKKNPKHEVRYYNHPDGGNIKHEYFNTAKQAHKFAKENSHHWAPSNVYHRGERKGTYWQGK